ncbi:MAG: hypothetical protein LBJ96_01335, partial [Holosporaceae bacterium]|nr:hypothetical protein [Holosporaceae bacterium]
IKYDKWAPDIRERYMMDAEELYHHWDCPATKALYEAEDKGRAEGIAVGEARGREEKREMVRQLLRNNVDMNVIAISSGLSIEEIESLKAH